MPTVVKANYRQIPKANAAKAAQVRTHLRAGLDYYRHRPGEEGERSNRTAFTGHNDAVSREEAHGVVDSAQGRYAYRMVMSPDPQRKLSEGQLREWTRAVMREVQASHVVGEFAAVAHTDQTKQPHVHVVAVSASKFSVEDFRAMREVGDREQGRILERDAGDQAQGAERAVDRTSELQRDSSKMERE